MDKGTLEGLRGKWTADFLAAYELGKRLAKTDNEEIAVESTPEEDVAAREECARHVRPFDGNIATGQVRMQWGAEKPTYVLIARKWGSAAWLVIPFSPYSSPATDTELKMQTDGGLGLRVLQLWNAFTLLGETLERSWLVHTLPAEETRDALTAWRWSVGVGELTEDQLSRTGLPITNRHDARVEYRREEIDKFAELLAEDLALMERRAWEAVVRKALAERKAEAFRAAPAFEEDMALAAAGAKEAVSADCAVAGFDGKVHVRYNPADRGLAVRVFGTDGEYSDALDGWGVFGVDADLLGVIGGSAFRHQFAEGFNGVLALANPDGDVYPLSSDTQGK